MLTSYRLEVHCLNESPKSRKLPVSLGFGSRLSARNLGVVSNDRYGRICANHP